MERSRDKPPHSLWLFDEYQSALLVVGWNYNLAVTMVSFNQDAASPVCSLLLLPRPPSTPLPLSPPPKPSRLTIEARSKRTRQLIALGGHATARLMCSRWFRPTQAASLSTWSAAALPAGTERSWCDQPLNGERPREKYLLVRLSPHTLTHTGTHTHRSFSAMLVPDNAQEQSKSDMLGF